MTGQITDNPSQKNVVIHSPERDFDVLKSESTLKNFCAFIRDVIAHFEENKRIQEAAEARESDLRHCMEMTEDLTAEEKAHIFDLLTEALQTRRTCKVENEVLKPIYDQVVDKNLLNRLSQIQGQIGTVKRTIADRSYACRTDVLDDFRVESNEDQSVASQQDDENKTEEDTNT